MRKDFVSVVPEFLFWYFNLDVCLLVVLLEMSFQVPDSRQLSPAAVMFPHQQYYGIQGLGEEEQDDLSTTASR